MRKRVAYGWIEDQSFWRDYDTCEIVGKAREDTTLKDFEFSPDVTLDRVRLRIPLIAKKKEFWTKCGHIARRVKVTIEFVPKKKP